MEVGSGSHQGGLWVTAETPFQARKGVVGGERGRRGRVSAYPDWTAQVEKTPGSGLIKTQRGSRPSLMINEEVRGVALPARLSSEGARVGRAPQLIRPGGWGWVVRGEGL